MLTLDVGILLLITKFTQGEPSMNKLHRSMRSTSLVHDGLTSMNIFIRLNAYGVSRSVHQPDNQLFSLMGAIFKMKGNVLMLTLRC